MQKAQEPGQKMQEPRKRHFVIPQGMTGEEFAMEFLHKASRQKPMNGFSRHQESDFLRRYEACIERIDSGGELTQSQKNWLARWEKKRGVDAERKEMLDDIRRHMFAQL